MAFPRVNHPPAGKIGPRGLREGGGGAVAPGLTRPDCLGSLLFRATEDQRDEREDTKRKSAIQISLAPAGCGSYYRCARHGDGMCHLEGVKVLLVKRNPSRALSAN